MPHRTFGVQCLLCKNQTMSDVPRHIGTDFAELRTGGGRSAFAAAIHDQYNVPRQRYVIIYILMSNAYSASYAIKSLNQAIRHEPFALDQHKIPVGSRVGQRSAAAPNVCPSVDCTIMSGSIMRPLWSAVISICRDASKCQHYCGQTQ